MPYATNDAVRIHYEMEGSGPPLVLHHGFMLSLENWRDNGFVAALRDDYTVILIDARGHGASDKPHTSTAYTIDKRAADVVAVLDHAGIERAIFWGYSMGGHVGYALLHYAPERFDAVIVGGAHPYARDPAPPDPRAEILRTGGMAQHVANEEMRYGVRFPEPNRSRMLANDVEALAAAMTTSTAPSFVDALTNARIPVLVYAGDRDMVYAESERSCQGLAHVRFIALPGLDHAQCNRASAAVTAHVRTFLADIGHAANASM